MTTHWLDQNALVSSNNVSSSSGMIQCKINGCFATMINGRKIIELHLVLEDRQAIAYLRRAKDASLPKRECSNLVATTALMTKTQISIAMSITMKLIGLLTMMIGVTSIKAGKAAVTDVSQNITT